jgi:hypothetical protein
MVRKNSNSYCVARDLDILKQLEREDE